MRPIRYINLEQLDQLSQNYFGQLCPGLLSFVTIVLRKIGQKNKHLNKWALHTKVYITRRFYFRFIISTISYKIIYKLSVTFKLIDL